MSNFGYVKHDEIMNQSQIKIGDTVRFVANKFDEHGRITKRVMKVTGKLVEIEPVGACGETSFPKYWVNRNGKVYWYSGCNLMLIKSCK